MADVNLDPLIDYSIKPENQGIVWNLATQRDPGVILDQLPEDVRKHLATLEGASQSDLARAIQSSKKLGPLYTRYADRIADKLYSVIQEQARRSHAVSQQRSSSGAQSSSTAQQSVAKQPAPASSPTATTQPPQSQSGAPISTLISNIMAVAAPLAPVVAPYFVKLLGLDQSKGGTPGLLTQAFLRNVPGFGLPATSGQAERPQDTMTAGQRYGLGEQTVSKSQGPVSDQRSAENQRFATFA